MNRKKWAAIIIGGFCVISALLACLIIQLRSQEQASGEVRIDPAVYYEVSKIVDGDTFRVKIDGKEITIRMLGIDTPETVDPRKPAECYGAEASAEAKKLLSGRTVRLESNPNRERRDRYGRYLLYVYRNDGQFVNEAMIKGGFAREYTYGKAYLWQKAFKSDQSNAKAARKGQWEACNEKSLVPPVELN